MRKHQFRNETASHDIFAEKKKKNETWGNITYSAISPPPHEGAARGANARGRTEDVWLSAWKDKKERSTGSKVQRIYKAESESTGERRRLSTSGGGERPPTF